MLCECRISLVAHLVVDLRVVMLRVIPMLVCEIVFFRESFFSIVEDRAM